MTMRDALKALESAVASLSQADSLSATDSEADERLQHDLHALAAKLAQEEARRDEERRRVEVNHQWKIANADVEFAAALNRLDSCLKEHGYSLIDFYDGERRCMAIVNQRSADEVLDCIRRLWAVS